KAPALGRFRISTTNDVQIARRVGIPGDVLQIVDGSADSRTAEQSQRVKSYFRTIAPSLKGLRDQIAALEKSRPTMPTVPVLQELTGDQRRKTTIFLRGNFLSKGAEVDAGLPPLFATANSPASAGRLELAKWVIDPENPLTARVAVNRF